MKNNLKVKIIIKNKLNDLYLSGVSLQIHHLCRENENDGHEPKLEQFHFRGVLDDK